MTYKKRTFTYYLTTVLTLFLFMALILLGIDGHSPTQAADLVLSGNEVMTIENTTQTGNIYVKDNAKLTVRNATLIVNISYHEEFDIIVSENATLEIIDSTVKTPLENEIQRIIMKGASRLTFQGSNLTEGLVYISAGTEGGGYSESKIFTGNIAVTNSKIHNISVNFLPEGGGTISVGDSQTGTFCLRFDNNYEGEFSDLKPGKYASWTYTEHNYNISFTNTQIDNFTAAGDGPSQTIFRNCEIFQLAPASPSAAIKMTAIDSKINQLPLHGLANIKAKMWGLKTGHYDDWRLSDHSIVTQGELPALILQNTDVTDWWLVSAFGGSELEIDDSKLEFRVYFDPSYTKITNSAIVYRLMFYNSKNGVVEFDNTSIENLNVYVPPVSAAIKGNITFPETAKITNWDSPSTIKRTYPVTILGEDGSIPPAANLYLYDKGNVLVWSGQTDSQGKASFDINFDDDNHNDNWRLDIVARGKTTNKTIKLLTSTPISETYVQIGAPISWENTKIAALFSDYGADSGIWSHDGSSWRRLTDWQPAQMIGYGTTGIMASFNDYGSDNGLYRYDGSSWSRLTDWVPGDMVSYSGGNIAGKFTDYSSGGNGIWRYNGSWNKLTDWQPDSMATLDSNTLVGKFSNYGSGNGVYKHDGSAWSRLTDWTPDSISSWGSRLTAIFTNYGSSGNGLWIYDSSWKRATDWQPAKVLSWKNDTLLAGIFSNHGSGNGLYSYNGSSWTRLTDWVPTDMTKLGTEDLIAVFKDYSASGNGVWKYSNSSSSWTRLTDWVPEAISNSGDYLTAVFTNYGSSGNGVWKYRDGSWTRLTDWTSKEPKP